MKSLGSRLTVWYVLAVMLTMTGAFVAGNWLLNHELTKGLDLLNIAEFREIPMRAEANTTVIPKSELMNHVSEEAKLDAALYLFQIRGDDGTILFRSDNLGGGTLPQNPPGVSYWTAQCAPVGPVRIAEFTEGPLRVQVASPLRNVNRLMRAYLVVGGAMLGVVLLVSIALGVWLKTLALDPIRRIQKTATRISAENLSERIPVGDSNDELSDLARLLNDVFGRLESSFFQLWRFAGNASHELKTPLSIIRLQSEKLLARENLTNAGQESVHQQLESISRLSAVIEKLLFLARSEARGIDLNLKTQCTGKLITAFSEDASVLCEEAGVEFAVSETVETEATFDAALLRQVLLNLLSNALRFTPQGGRITISSKISENRWIISVTDTGPGLPAKSTEEIFEPFVRVGPPPRQRASAGEPESTGLGLAICRSILLLHQGHIRAENVMPGPGLRVTFDLPLAQAAQVAVSQAKV